MQTQENEYPDLPISISNNGKHHNVCGKLKLDKLNFSFF